MFVKSDFSWLEGKFFTVLLFISQADAAKPVRQRGPEKRIKQHLLAWWITAVLICKGNSVLKAGVEHHHVTASGQSEEASLSLQKKKFSTAVFKHVIAHHAISTSCLIKKTPWEQSPEERWWTGSKGTRRRQQVIERWGSEVGTPHKMFRNVTRMEDGNKSALSWHCTAFKRWETQRDLYFKLSKELHLNCKVWFYHHNRTSDQK